MSDFDKRVRIWVAGAELVGSRGRARHFGRPEPDGVDHDYIRWVDTPAQMRDLWPKLCLFCIDDPKQRYRFKTRLTGYTAVSHVIDISIYPRHERPWVLKYWEHRERGEPKEACSDVIDFARREWLKTAAAKEWLHAFQSDEARAIRDQRLKVLFNCDAHIRESVKGGA